MKAMRIPKRRGREPKVTSTTLPTRLNQRELERETPCWRKTSPETKREKFEDEGLFGCSLATTPPSFRHDDVVGRFTEANERR